MKHLKTKFKKSTIRSLAIGAVLCGTLSAAQAEFSNVYVFGDSYSDTGNYSWFSNSATAQGIWASRIATHYGFTMTPAYAGYTGSLTVAPNSSGTGFAIGGGQTHDVPGVKGSNTQIQDLLTRASGKLDSKALYLVLIGGNDINAALTAVATAGFSSAAIATAQTTIATAGASVASQIGKLRAAGAKNIVVLNLPNFAVFPITTLSAMQVEAQTTAYLQSLGMSATAAAAQAAQAKGGFMQMANLLPTVFNAALASTLPKDAATTFDTSTFVSNLFANPAAFGLTNLTSPACGLQVDWNKCHGVADKGALFADPLHMSDAGHALLADWVAGSLDATTAGAGLSSVAVLVPLGRSGAEWRTIDNRLRGFQNFAYQGDRMFAAGDYADARSDAANGAKAAEGHTWTGSVGYETSLGPNTLAGGTFGRERGSFDLANNAGRLIYNETMLSLYATKSIGDWYVNGLVSLGQLDFTSSRNVTIGAVSNFEQSSFGGRHEGVKVQVGYRMRSAGLVHGPFIGVDWERAGIDGFSEGGSVTAITVGKQNVAQAHSRLGYEVAGEVSLGGAAVRPYAQLSYDTQHLKGERTYYAGMASTGTLMPVSAENATGGFGRLAAGFSTKVSKDSEVSVGVSTTFSNPAGRDTALNVVWSAPL